MSTYEGEHPTEFFNGLNVRGQRKEGFTDNCYIFFNWSNFVDHLTISEI
jgi:hypothetical protein